MSDTGATFPERRDELEAEQAHLRAQLSDLAHDVDPGETDGNFADRAEVAAEVGESRAIAAELRDQLNDVERALEKLDAGTYGRCEVCDQPIGAERLDAMPAARTCIEHAV